MDMCLTSPMLILIKRWRCCYNGSGIAKGSDRINEAIKDALHSPLLNNNDVFSSKKILINLCLVKKILMMEEMNALHDFMSKFSKEIEVIWGAVDEPPGRGYVRL